MQISPEYFEELFDRPIAYHRAFVPFAGVTGAVFLSQALYWSRRLPEERGGWFYKTQEEWTEETGLTRYEQESVRKKLVSLGILEEKREGLPAKLWYRLRIDVLQTKMLETRNQECGKPTNWNAENQQPYYTETTTETTSETTKEMNKEKRFVSLKTQKVGLKEIPEETLERIAADYQVPMSFVASKYEDMVLWAESSGKHKKDWVATLRNFVKKDALQIRKEEHGRRKHLAIIS